MLTGLEPTCMGLTQSNSGLFRTPDFIVSPVGKEKEGKKETKRRRDGGKKGIEKKGGKEEGIKKIGGKRRKGDINKIKTKK